MFEEFSKLKENSYLQDNDPPGAVLSGRMREEGHFLGMTPQQRFVAAILLLLMIIILGVLLLLVTYKIVPSFLG
ncbi:MAG TPA: hypothetical protein VLD65_05055 [Anaerolineales bacterium]|nr:hypothetical protein [Anaerolineales bacterium]